MAEVRANYALAREAGGTQLLQPLTDTGGGRIIAAPIKIVTPPDLPLTEVLKQYGSEYEKAVVCDGHETP